MQSSPPDEPSTHPAAPRFSRGAAASFVLGLASPFLFFLSGVPAVWLGVNAIRAINAAEGRLRGRRFAVMGALLGAMGCVAAVLGLVVVVFTTLRVRSQRMECENNLRRIGSAVLKYHTTNDFFPPGTLPNPDLPPDRRLSWLTELPPYLEQKTIDARTLQGLYEKLDPKIAWDADPNATVAHATVPLFLCPAHTSEQPGLAPGRTDYVGIAGVGPDAAELPLSDPRAGMFGCDRVVRRADVMMGTSDTLMVTETARDNGPWTAGGPSTVRGVDPAEAPLIGSGRPFGGVHPGGLNALFADGSARFLRDDTSPAFLATLTRLRADEAPAP